MPNKGKFGMRSTPSTYAAAESPRTKAVMEIAALAKKQRKASGDFMPKGLRKVADFAGQVVGGATNVGSNVDALLKTVSGKRLKLPTSLRRAGDNPIAAVADPLDALLKRRKK